ncbi:ama1 protein, putative [Bodo saltans]|uniref:Ama1 protein, putative n=1 Tax=Bodo saltans TaxID=75058 RepID=A0A0S4J017_BODSA|nr:ama1 protein, putative [Bodo saltans]|eukprot:CUG73281.1 ama1 protein, putative [Bodo saltans]
MGTAPSKDAFTSTTYQTGLFECCGGPEEAGGDCMGDESSLPSCLEGWCCPWYQTVIQLNSTAIEPRTDLISSRTVKVTLIDLMTCGCFLRCLQARARTQLNKRYGITREPRIDSCCIGFWCVCCSVAQVHREMCCRHEFPGGSCIMGNTSYYKDGFMLPTPSVAHGVPLSPSSADSPRQNWRNPPLRSQQYVTPTPAGEMFVLNELYLATYHLLLLRQQNEVVLCTHETQMLPWLQMYYLKGQTVQGLQHRQEAGQPLSPQDLHDLQLTIEQLAVIEQHVALESQPQPAIVQQPYPYRLPTAEYVVPPFESQPLTPHQNPPGWISQRLKSQNALNASSTSSASSLNSVTRGSLSRNSSLFGGGNSLPAAPLPQVTPHPNQVELI